MTNLKILAVALFSTSMVFGDTVVMKNGEKVEGLVLRDDAENYYVEVHFSATIKEEKVIPKAEVEKVLRDTEDQKAFVTIAEQIPTPEMLPKEGYEARIALVSDFIKKYPSSRKVSEAKSILEKLQSEQDVILSGGVKYGSEMISAADYNANAYFYDATLAEKSIQEAIGRRDFLIALRQFSAYEQKVGIEPSNEEFLTLIKKVLIAHSTLLRKSIDSFDDRMKKRASDLKAMSGEDRIGSKKALEELDREIEARYDSEKKAGQLWVTPDINHKESLTDGLKQAEKTLKGLEKPTKKRGKTSSGVAPAEAYRQAWGKLTGGSDEEKEKVMKEAKDSGLPDYYLEKLAKHGAIASE